MSEVDVYLSFTHSFFGNIETEVCVECDYYYQVAPNALFVGLNSDCVFMLFKIYSMTFVTRICVFTDGKLCEKICWNVIPYFKC